MVHPPAAEAAPSQLLDGRYRLIRQIGRGGMGAVFLGEDTRLKRQCALKVLHGELAADRTNVERFLREAQIIAQLDHPNIVDIYSVGEDPSGLVFFAMELLHGEDLDARLRRREGPPDIREICQWGVQIARAMAAVHDAGLIHRDLKASNIFLARRRDGEEVCKLLDFGIARGEQRSELTGTGVALGTPSYMAPEQICNHDVDRRADIYSFGVLLFKLLTGRVPFLGTALQVAVQHRDVAPPTPSQVAPQQGISPRLDAIVLKAMAKRPDDRQQSMRELEAALADIAREVAPATPPVPPPRRPIRSVSMEVEICLSSGPHRAVPPVMDTLDGATPGSLSPPTIPTLTRAQPVTRASRTQALTVVLLGTLLLVIVILLRTRHTPAPVATPSEPAVTIDIPAAKPEPAPPRPVQAVVVTPLPAPELELPPAAKPAPRRRAARPTDPANVSTARPPDPLKQIARKAAQCRRKFDAVDGPPIIIDYAIGGDGTVTRAIALEDGELGACLAAAVAATSFGATAPALGLKLPL